jgi:glycosyltransferase involved in cell wall biosynthesis
VGQLIDRKNVRELIEAFAEIKDPGDSLTIVGQGELRERLIKQVSSLGISKQVKFIGQLDQEELVHQYAKADTLVLPSTNEVWGLVVNEALACGLQVVVSKKAGVSHFIKDMKGVYLTEPNALDIAVAMHQSKQSFAGTIKNPEILKYTPQLFACELQDKLFI